MKNKEDPRTKKFLYKQTESERAVRIVLKKLEAAPLQANSKICDDLTLKELMTALMSADDFINYTKFEMGNDWGWDPDDYKKLQAKENTISA